MFSGHMQKNKKLFALFIYIFNGNCKKIVKKQNTNKFYKKIVKINKKKTIHSKLF